MATTVTVNYNTVAQQMTGFGAQYARIGNFQPFTPFEPADTSPGVNANLSRILSLMFGPYVSGNGQGGVGINIVAGNSLWEAQGSPSSVSQIYSTLPTYSQDSNPTDTNANFAGTPTVASLGMSSPSIDYAGWKGWSCYHDWANFLNFPTDLAGNPSPAQLLGIYPNGSLITFGNGEVDPININSNVLQGWMGDLRDGTNNSQHYGGGGTGGSTGQQKFVYVVARHLLGNLQYAKLNFGAGFANGPAWYQFGAEAIHGNGALRNSSLGNDSYTGGQFKELTDLIERSCAAMRAGGFTTKLIIGTDESTGRVDQPDGFSSYDQGLYILQHLTSTARAQIGALGYHQNPYTYPYCYLPNILNASGAGTPNRDIQDRIDFANLVTGADGNGFGGLGLQVWMTATSHGAYNSPNDSFQGPAGFCATFDCLRARAIDIHDQLFYARASAYLLQGCFCDTNNTQEGFPAPSGLTQLEQQNGADFYVVGDTGSSTWKITQAGFAVGHYARWVQAGDSAVNATVAADTNGRDAGLAIPLVQVSAFKNTRNSIVVVAINNDTVSRSGTFNVNGTPIGGQVTGEESADPAFTSGAVPWTALTPFNVTSSTSFSYTLKPRSVTTFSVPLQTNVTYALQIFLPQPGQGGRSTVTYPDVQTYIVLVAPTPPNSPIAGTLTLSIDGGPSSQVATFNSPTVFVTLPVLKPGNHTLNWTFAATGGGTASASNSFTVEGFNTSINIPAQQANQGVGLAVQVPVGSTPTAFSTYTLLGTGITWQFVGCTQQVAVFLDTSALGTTGALTCAQNCVSLADTAYNLLKTWYGNTTPGYAMSTLLISPAIGGGEHTGDNILYCQLITSDARQTAFIWVAEHTEFLMNIQNLQGFGAGDSDGEGLSRFHADLAFPGVSPISGLGWEWLTKPTSLALNWQVLGTGITSQVLTDSLGSSLPTLTGTTGTVTVSPTASDVYTLTATNTHGTATATKRVSRDSQDVLVNLQSLSGLQVASGTAVTVNWTVALWDLSSGQFTSTIQLNNGTPIAIPQGTVSYTSPALTVSTTFTVTVTDVTQNVTASASLTVGVGAAPGASLTINNEDYLRPDWVNNAIIAQGDRDAFAFGCANLFLYWLLDSTHGGPGKTVAQVTQGLASTNGIVNTLAALYRVLTGSSAAWTNFLTAANSAFALTGSNAQNTYNQNSNLWASLTPPPPGPPITSPPNPLPSTNAQGTLNWSINGGTQTPVTLDATGKASFTLPSNLSPGSYTLNLRYVGFGVFAPASQDVPLTVQATSTTVRGRRTIHGFRGGSRTLQSVEASDNWAAPTAGGPPPPPPAPTAAILLSSGGNSGTTLNIASGSTVTIACSSTNTVTTASLNGKTSWTNADSTVTSIPQNGTPFSVTDKPTVATSYTYSVSGPGGGPVTATGSVSFTGSGIPPALATINSVDVLQGTAQTSSTFYDHSAILQSNDAIIRITYNITVPSGGSASLTGPFQETASGPLALTADGASHTVGPLHVTSSLPGGPPISGIYQMHAFDGPNFTGSEVIFPLSIVVQDNPALPALDPNTTSNAPTVVSTGSGEWMTPGTWTVPAGRNPGANAGLSSTGLPDRDSVVQIQAGHHIHYSGRGGQFGRLLFQTGATLTIDTASGSTALVGTDIDLTSAGTLTMDCTSNGAPCLVIFRNRPQHANDGNSFWRGCQVGTGGTLIMRGPAITPFVRVAPGVDIGTVASGLVDGFNAAIPLASAPTNWQLGRKLIIPQTSVPQEASGSGGQYAFLTNESEVVILAGLTADGSGNLTQLWLRESLDFDHRSAHDSTNAVDVGGTSITGIGSSTRPAFTPHIANLIRPVGFVSTDPTTPSTRCHFRATGRAVIDIDGAGMHGMGRTDNTGTVNNATGHRAFNCFFEDLLGPQPTLSGGKVVAGGMSTLSASSAPATGRDLNQAQYPVTNQNIVRSGYQYWLNNCVMLDPWPIVNDFPTGVTPGTTALTNVGNNVRWGIAVEGSSYGYIGNNVSFNWTGSCIAISGANEHYNIIERNFTCGCFGVGGQGFSRGNQDLAFEGNGIWFNSPNNYLRDNVITAVGTYQIPVAGFGPFGLYCVIVVPTNRGGTKASTGNLSPAGDPIRIPLYQGADQLNGVQGTDYQVVASLSVQLLQCERNEIYSTPFGWVPLGLNATGVGGPMYGMGYVNLLKDLWTWNNVAGHFRYGIQNMILDGWVNRQDTRYAFSGLRTFGFSLTDYEAYNQHLLNCDVQGAFYGLLLPSKYQSTNDPVVNPYCIIRNSLFRNFQNIVVEMPLSTNHGQSVGPDTTIVDSCLFGPAASPGQPPAAEIDTVFGQPISFGNPSTLANSNTLSLHRLLIYQYNKGSTDYQIFDVTQDPTAITPGPADGDATSVVAPVNGQTNQFNLTNNGVCLYGQLAPTSGYQSLSQFQQGSGSYAQSLATGTLSRAVANANPPKPVTASVPTSITATHGQPLTLTGTVVGGTGPYSYKWYFGDGNSATGNPATHTYPVAGMVFTALFCVTDNPTFGNGIMSFATTKVTVV